MRTIPIVLCLSLAANVVFGVICLKLRDSGSLTEKKNPVTAADGVGSAKKIPAPDLARLSSALKTDDKRSVFDQLRAIGFSEINARDLVNSMIWSKYYKRQSELLAVKGGESKPYWRGLDKTASTLTVAERKELRDLASDARRESSALLGSGAFSSSERTAARFSFLPQEKVAQLLDLGRDYGEMAGELNEESNRFKVASDSAKQRLLREEQRKDLEAILTPAELAEYDQRFSPAAMVARRGFAGIDGTEAEYQAVYDSLKIMNALYSTNQYTWDMSANPERAAALREAQHKSNDEIKALLGEERYAEYMRMQSQDYRTLQAAADRFQIPAATINNVYALRDTASSESQRISTDTTLSAADKKQALKNLAENIKTQVRTQLGDEVSAAYLEKNMSWLQRMSAGNPVRFTPTR